MVASANSTDAASRYAVKKVVGRSMDGDLAAVGARFQMVGDRLGSRIVHVPQPKGYEQFAALVRLGRPHGMLPKMKNEPHPYKWRLLGFACLKKGRINRAARRILALNA